MRAASARKHRADVARLIFVACAGCGSVLCALVRPFAELMHYTDVAGWRWDACKPYCPRCVK